MENIKELQQKALEMYEYFSKFCDDNNLRYYVCGGACIGAIRHKGFIPWDDDIDLFMPRPDYEKLVSIWNEKGNKEKYTLCRTNKNINYHDGGTLLKDNNTTFINSHSVNEDIHHGYMMDIIPLDGCAPLGFKRKIQKINAAIYSLFNVQRLPDNQGKKIRMMAKVILGLVPSKKIRYFIWKKAQKNMSKYNFDESKYITELVTGFRYMKNEYPKNVFDGYKLIKFEDILIKIPNNYDFYLKKAFGNYMELPPEDKRVPKHDVVFYDLNNSYKIYKGKKYLVK